MKCKKCGNEVKDGNLFCVNCGTYVEKDNTNEKITKENDEIIKKSKSKLIIMIIIIIMVVGLGIGILLSKNNKSNDTNNISNKKDQVQEDNQIELAEDDEEGEWEDELLNEIYEKHPELKSGEILICTDIDGNYWLLDDDGKKIYFSDLETFESALQIYKESIGESKPTLDIDRFIKELSYSSMSTVHNSNYGGDGYRSDNGFFNNDLTKSSFNISTEGNEIKYTVISNNSQASDVPMTLEIITTDSNALKEIKISCPSSNMKVYRILLCAQEVEDALGYTLINARNYEIVNKVEKELKLENYISGEDDTVIQKNQSVTVEDEKENKKITFTIGENSFEYKMTF